MNYMTTFNIKTRHEKSIGWWFCWGFTA